MTAVPQSRTFDILGLDLNGYVAMPPNPTRLVLFARGPGGSHDDERDVRVAVASPTGRPDLAGEFLLIARAPTLLVVGEYDAQLRARNEDAADRIAGPTRIAVLDDVGHVIDEPRAQVVLAEMCRDWFRALLRPRAKARAR